MAELKKIPEPTKGSGDKYITTRSAEYTQAVKLAGEYFVRLNYHVYHGWVWRNEQNKVITVANLMCEDLEGGRGDLALLIAFPKKRQNSTGRLLARLGKLVPHTDDPIGVILAYSTRGTGTFPAVSKRIWSTHKLVRIFVLDLVNRTIKQLSNPDIGDESKQQK